ncbi:MULTISPECIES: HAD-IIIA family hydrolase [unclassified Bacillus (in: firmicutes)]|uniref:HAD-IIIA family hydrolase n=1 Tax=unclassified Bacillus (in: firmicutes) TaxID=185979 RepID=UPI0034E88B78
MLVSGLQKFVIQLNKDKEKRHYVYAFFLWLNKLGLMVFLYINQTKIGRGYFTEKELLKGFQKMQQILKDEDVYIDGMYYCPHNSSCDCQKPNIGLLLKATEEHDLCLKDCFLIGDTGSTDMIAAKRANIKKILVRTGWDESSLTKYRNLWIETAPDYIAENLLDAVCWIDEYLRT